jgi:hypothetical protein
MKRNQRCGFVSALGETGGAEKNVSQILPELSSALFFTLVFSAALRLEAGELNPAALPAVGHSQLRIINPTTLELTLITTKAPDPAPPTVWNFVDSNYNLQLPPASDFDVRIGTNAAAISAIGFKRRPLYAPLKVRDLRIENSLYLRLSAPIPDGQTVVVKNPPGNLWSERTTHFTASTDPFRFNPAIHVNQTGYLPQGPKKAMVGYYLGSLGELPIATTTFQIIHHSSGQPAFSGTLRRRVDHGFVYSPPPYQQVFETDFSALQTPGEYRLHVPSMGTSFPFYIHDGAAGAFARTLALGVYHQRCGGKNELPYTRHDHGLCHIAPAEIPTMSHQSVNQQLAAMTADFAQNPRHTAPQLKSVDASLYPFVKQGAIDVSLGHHDAGDYSKYTINSAALIHHLVFAADNFPGAGSLDNLGLPESSDGKSDLLQEAKWEADFLARMQDSDGGFYFLVYPRDRAYEQDVLPDHGDPQVVFPKNTAGTAAAVGALAEIASSPLFRQQFPSEATNYLAKAVLGWSFLTNAIASFGKDGAYQKITHYGNEFMHDDELAWAAAALFVATGEPAFHNQLMAWYDPAGPQTRRWTWWRLFEGYGCAARAYAFAPRNGRIPASALDANYLAAIQSEIIAAADDIARFAEESAYGTSFPTPNKRQRSAGWFFSTERAFELAVAQQLAPQQRYLDALISNANYEAGCNPVNMNYVTGIGWRRWREIVHQYAQNDHRVLPPSGIPLGNIQAGFSWLDNYKQELGALTYPPDGAAENPYPFYDRWGDTFNTTTEFTVADQSRSLASYALLFGQSAISNSVSVKVLGTITGLPQSTAAGQPLTAHFHASGVDLSQARIVWEARDNEPYIGPFSSFAAKNPGEQWVEAEAQLPDGTRVFGRTSFSATAAASIPPNGYQSAPLQNSAELIALYHADEDGVDSTGKNAPLSLAGNGRYDALNLSWMAQRSGSALRFYDLGDKATVSIPATLLYSSTSQEITLEAMVYVNAYKAYNRSTARLLSLHKSWNASLEWLDDIYSGQHIRGGTQFDLFGSTLNAAMPQRQWHHLSITIGRTNYSARVNGNELANVSASEFGNWNGGTASLELGNFDGWIDEVVIRSARTPRDTIPAAPTGPAATALSPKEVQLTWMDKSTNETGFRIYRSTNDVDYMESITAPAEATSASDTNVSPGTTYYYGIRAFNGAGESQPAIATVTTPEPSPVPVAPTNLTATAVSRSRINLTWEDRSNNESYFEVEGSDDAQDFGKIATLPANSTTFSNFGLPRNRTYYYRVRAINAAGPSDYSNTASARTLR